MDRRDEFLLRMYEQLFNEINRHILVVWQSVGVTVSAFAVFALKERGLLPIDLAVTLILLLVAWFLAHIEDAGYWYNRNNAIIANIEKEFLRRDDLRIIHYYFGKARPANTKILHLRIQCLFGASVGILAYGYHVADRVYPGLCLMDREFDPTQYFPTLAILAIVVSQCWLRRRFQSRYEEFCKNSPGWQIDSSDIEYGEGHGFSSDHPTSGYKNAEGAQTGQLSAPNAEIAALHAPPSSEIPPPGLHPEDAAAEPKQTSDESMTTLPAEGQSEVAANLTIVTEISESSKPDPPFPNELGSSVDALTERNANQLETSGGGKALES